MKRILSFSLTPRATARNIRQDTNLRNFGVQIAFLEQFDYQNKKLTVHLS